MEGKESSGEQQAVTLVVPSKKVQVNSLEHELAASLLNAKDTYEQVATVRIEGNSYSLPFCQAFADILKATKNIKDLNINDMFVGRLKDEIPKSIEYISKGLVGSGLLRLDISNNAVNPYGAEALLIFLSQAASLQVLLINNCGLGPMGVAKIAEGFKGTPTLRTVSIGRNRMEDEGILSIAEHLSFVPQLEELFVYQNTLKEKGLTLLFKQLRENCKTLVTLDLCDNFVRGVATKELVLLLQEGVALRNINLSDCLKEEENPMVVEGFKGSPNRQWERLGFNFAELNEELSLELLDVLKQCPLKRLDITGNDFNKKVKKAYAAAFPVAGVLSRFDDDDEDEEEVLKLFEELKI